MEDRNIIIIDNFYNDADEVVKEAKKLEYRTDVVGGHFDRTCGMPFGDFQKGLIPYLEKYIGRDIAIDSTWTDTENWNNINGSFYKTHESVTPNHIHHDWSDWTGVVYLSKNLPPNVGTQFWRHKETQADFFFDNNDSYGNYNDKLEIPYDNRGEDEGRKDFERTDFVSYKYNRLLLFRGTMFHSADFPDNMEIGSRFNQIFYFNIANPP